MQLPTHSLSWRSDNAHLCYQLRRRRCRMIAVIFEVLPAAGRKEDYLHIAAHLRSTVEQVEGFISVERFQSLTDPDKILSLSFFEDEAAIARWRNLDAHRRAQSRGRGDVFQDYRLRIAHVVRDYGMFDRAEAPGDSQELHDGDLSASHPEDQA